MRRVQVAPTAEALAFDAAEEFIRITTDAAEKRRRCTVALTGGSTSGGLYRALAHTETLRARVPWDRIEFFWGDERFVPPDHVDSNYRLAHEAMLSAIPLRPEQIHRVQTERADPAGVALAYEKDIRATFGTDVEVPRFDLILLGVGTDGHIASLFPGTSALHETEKLCIENRVPTLGSYRITMTFPLLNQARAVVVMVSGPAKSSIVRQVLAGTPPTTDLPAQLLRPAGDVIWMLDGDAASGLGDLAS